MTDHHHTIEIKELRKRYGDQPVLDGISFSAVRGEIVALLGESGAGKSTLLRCLNLLEVPDEGDLRIASLDFSFVTPHTKVPRRLLLALRKKVGMVFQRFHLWEHMTVMQNLVEAPRQVLKLSKKEAIEKASLLLSQMGVSDKASAYPSQLSGGQQQRVAIIRALMMGPEVMLFDEPTSALDPKRTADTLSLIRGLAEKGMTVVVASHEMGFVRELSDKTVFLSHGKIIEYGETQTLFSSPKTEIFKQFIQSVGNHS